MENTIYHDRIDRYIDTVAVAHKIGDYGAVANDIGIVFTKEPYVITVYTDDIVSAYEKIAELSKIIYEYNTTG